jgi:Mlc titration factor MtfA (ptsG expression regulator)
VLVLAREHDYFEAVQSVLVYPTAFEMPATHADESGLVLEGKAELLGQAWYRGPILLAWDEVLHDCKDPERGQNVIFHEFAHALDYEGAPVGSGGKEGEEKLRRFGAVMQTEYEALVKASTGGRATLLDTYGSTNPSEFFAVATECFFGRPVEMLLRHPELYGVLREFYNQDSAARFLLRRT